MVEFADDGSHNLQFTGSDVWDSCCISLFIFIHYDPFAFNLNVIITIVDYLTDSNNTVYQFRTLLYFCFPKVYVKISTLTHGFLQC